MNISIDFVIYSYMTVCLSLLIFNFAYIFRAKRKSRNKAKDVQKWRNEVFRQINLMMEGESTEPKHVRELSKRLTKIDALISYIQAIELIKSEFPEQLNSYIYAIYPLIQELAHKYGRKDSMERAFFADCIRRYPPYCGIEYRPILDILISYLDNSTVFCRENILCALYTLGNVRAIENALQILNDRRWFHHQRLISDGLAAFTGDKQALAAALWSKYKKWDDSLMLAVVQFITLCSPDYKDIFMPVLVDEKADIEIRLAVMRYYRKYPYEPVRPVLIEYLRNGGRTNENLAIAAASVLGQYPGSDTFEALINALGSRNWYVRQNAAASVIDIGTSEDKLKVVLEGDDKYARETLLYKLGREVKSVKEAGKVVCV